MERWRLSTCDPRQNDGAGLCLANRSSTLITVSRVLKNFDPHQFFRQIEELEFPLRYTDGVEKVCFTVLREAGGWYEDGTIWVDVGPSVIEHARSTFIHEVGHHVDEQENASPLLHAERLKRAKFLPEKLSQKEDDEYFAVGFQVFYSKDRELLKNLRKRNPQLYRIVRKLHSEYRWKG